MKKIDTKLSSKSIAETIRQLQTIKKNLKDCEEEITDELVNTTTQWVNENYSNTTDRPFNEDYIVTGEVVGNKGKVISSGGSVIYMEFGTGEIGKRSQTHPKRNDFNLNDFNSGPIVSKHINKAGEHYWFYNGEYTQGISAGLQVYNAAERLKKEKLTLAKRVVDYKIW